MDVIALAIPAFFLLMGVEWWVARWRRLPVYRFSDWVANLGCGIIQQTFKVALALFTFVAYRYLFEHHRLLELDEGAWWVWGLGFLAWDLAYYWFHRLSHEVNFLWAAHVVHHQSEEYNLGVALRQSAFQGGFSWVFYLPLALVGFPPKVFVICASLNLLYQFIIHTRVVDRLGPLEWVLNTPSHHRVHHGQNPQYIDRNHAGALIIWDRMFGTFEPEGEEVVYGVTEPPMSWNPFYANFHHWGLSWRRSRGARSFAEAARVWWDRPGFVPEGVPVEGKRLNGLDKYDVPASTGLRIYAVVWLLSIAGAATLYLFVRSTVPGPHLAAWGAGIILSAGSLGGLLDGARWAVWTEAVRPFLLVAALLGLRPQLLQQPTVLVGLGGAAAASVLALVVVKRTSRV